MRTKSFGQAAQFNRRQSQASDIPAAKRARPRSRSYSFAEPFNRRLNAAPAVRDIERIETDFDDAERAQDHGGVDVAHMSDPERLALQVADPDAQHHSAFFLAVTMQRGRFVTASHHHSRDGVGPPAAFGGVETEHLALGPDRDRP